MQTKIKTAVYAAKLRKKLAALKSKRERDLAKYKSYLGTWRTELTKWILSHARMRVEAIGAAELKSHARWTGRNGHFDASAFFSGCPSPPTYPSDEQIRAIQNLLRHLDIARYLGDESEE